MDFNNVSVVFDQARQSVYALMITPVNAPHTMYVWVRDDKEVAFKNEARASGIEFLYLHSQSIANKWAMASFKNCEVDLTEDEYIELSLSSEYLEKLNMLLDQGISFDKLVENALTNLSNDDCTTDT
jgi:hypothetical protein